MMRLRVAHIITQLELGGAQRNTLYTVGHLDPEHFDAFLLCGRGGILDPETQHASWPTHYIPGLVRPLRPWLDLAAFYQLYTKLRELRPHVVHTHSSKAGILGRVAAYLAGVPVILHTFHGFGFNRRQKPWTRWLFIAIEKLCAPLCAHLVFVSEENRKEAHHLKIGKNVPKSLVRSGIPLQSPQHKPLTTSEKRASNKIHKLLQSLPHDAWRVVYVGNFKPQKNPMDLVAVASQVLTINPQVHFLFAGDGELKASVEKECKEQGLQDHVHFLGWCQRREDVQDIFAASNCFLLTSLWEGLPRSLVEAMAAGLPAVVYGVDGTKDIVEDGETGYLITPHDTALAAEKILWLADHPEKARQMGKKGKGLITKDFDIDHMVRQQEVLYAKLYGQVPLKKYYEPLWGSKAP